MNKPLLALFLLIGITLQAQVGIGTLAPNASAQLDIVANDKGVLITRVALKSTTDNTTITNGNVESLLVYNIATTTDVYPGYYYWNNGKWQRILSLNDIQSTIKGINTTNSSLTTDGVDLILTDSDKNYVSIPLASLFSETVTSLKDNSNGSITYTDEKGNKTTIDISKIVANSAKITTLVKNTDGTYTYTSEDGTKTTVDVPADVLTEIQDNTSKVYQAIVSLIKAKETLTTFKQDDANSSGKITYTDEAGNKHSAEVVSTDTDNLISVGTDGGALLKAEDLDYLSTSAIKTINKDYTALTSDVILLANAQNKSIAITLPDPTTHKGKKYTIKKQSSDENHYVTVQGNFVGGTTEIYNALPYSGWEFVSNGTSWIIVNKF